MVIYKIFLFNSVNFIYLLHTSARILDILEQNYGTSLYYSLSAYSIIINITNNIYMCTCMFILLMIYAIYDTYFILFTYYSLTEYGLWEYSDILYHLCQRFQKTNHFYCLIFYDESSFS